jgi:hypothetical protein
MGELFRKIRKVVSEAKVDPEDVISFGKAATDNENLQNLKARFEKIIKMSGFDKSLRRVNIIGYGKMIAYYGDAREATRFEEWANKQFGSTKLNVIYKDLSVGESKAGVIFDFTRM